jgi:hypothetical protein
MIIDNEDVHEGQTWIVKTPSTLMSGHWSGAYAVTVTRTGEKTLSLGVPGAAITGSEPVYYFDEVMFIEQVKEAKVND